MMSRVKTEVLQDRRSVGVYEWLTNVMPTPIHQLHLLAGDASFRRYFRVFSDQMSYVVMDAPPEKEDCKPFISIGKIFSTQGLCVPEIYAADQEQGFLLLRDFGDQLYEQTLTPHTAPQLYSNALQSLVLIQNCKDFGNYLLPLFDENLYLRELALFEEWYLGQYCQIGLSFQQKNVLQKIFKQLIEIALMQPQVCVHRDYHSRNLMCVQDQSEPGILDFQDAVYGPITYDLVSLFKDCYIDWPSEQVQQWALHYQQLAIQKGILFQDNPQEFLRWFDLIGLQRHLKCLGIFARLHLRDQKPQYLKYMPRIIRYIVEVCAIYPEYQELLQYFS